MIQFNLLPDVKLQYLKAERTRRMVLVISALVSAAAIGLLVLLLIVNGLQKKHLDDLSADITAGTTRLQNQSQIGKILTVQNQLDSLTDLHAKKPASSRLFDYLNQVTPVPVAISNLTVDMTLQTVTITGTADSLSNVNKYVDTLKYTKYQADGGEATLAFKDVVLGSFGLATDATNGKPANYTITFTYDPVLFDIAQKVELKVPNQTTTRADLESPSDLFQSSGGTTTTGGGN